MKDKHKYGKKMVRKGRTNVIYKGTFISKQTLSKFQKILSLWLFKFFKRSKIYHYSTISSVVFSTILMKMRTVHKYQLFWEGHKNLYNLPHGFEIYLVNVKTIRQIAQIFTAFSEKLNFTTYAAISASSYVLIFHT